MNTIRIAGVPEHFNLPWHLNIENNIFSSKNIDLQWIDVPEGTGKMCEMLRNGETDLAVILTEGIVKDINSGNPSKIVQIFVESPLQWGIHVAANSDYKTVADLENKIAAISRFGSGSHLMSYVNAKNNNWEIDKLRFEVVNTIDGAVKSLTEGESDYFMWERFTTKPYVEKGIFRLVGNCPTPWPCFVIAARKESIEKNKNIISEILKTINSTTKNFKEINNIETVLADRYRLFPEDIKEWLNITEWSQKPLTEQMLNKIQNQLFELQIIDKKGTFAEIVEAI